MKTMLTHLTFGTRSPVTLWEPQAVSGVSGMGYLPSSPYMSHYPTTAQHGHGLPWTTIAPATPAHTPPAGSRAHISGDSVSVVFPVAAPASSAAGYLQSASDSSRVCLGAIAHTAETLPRAVRGSSTKTQRSRGATTLSLSMDGEDITYDAATVPDPPVQHFSKDVDRLFVHWHTSVILKVAGRGVAVKYWAAIYKELKRAGVKSTAWDEIKVEWGNWKVSQSRYCALSCSLCLPTR